MSEYSSKTYFCSWICCFSFINPIIMIGEFVELHKKEKHVVFQYVSYMKILCVPKYLFNSFYSWFIINTQKHVHNIKTN